jgi:hypothetical protein
VSSMVPPGRLAAYRIQNLLTERQSISFQAVSRFGIDERYVSRREYVHYGDQGAADQWQLEVYLHALGLMVKHSLQTVADLGCGSGYKLMTYFHAYQTLGFETSENIAYLRALYPDRDWRVANLEGDEQGPLDVDVMICSAVIERLVDPDRLVKWLKKQCFKYLVISTPARELAYPAGDPALYGPPRNRAHQREWTFPEFGSYMSAHFRVIDHRITNYHQATQLLIAQRSSHDEN